MRNRENAAIKKAANEIDTNAHLFFLDEENDGCAIQYTSDDTEIIARFFSAFSVKKKTTSRIIFSRLKKTGLPAIGLVKIAVDENIVVIYYERHLDRQYGYRNQADALEKFFTRNLYTVKSLTGLETLKKL